MAESDSELKRLSDQMGADALTWLLATDAVTLRAWIAGIVDPPGHVLAAAALLRALVTEVETRDGPSFFHIAQALGQYHPRLGRTLGAQIRIEAGGEIASPAGAADEVAAPLVHLAAELVGVYLLPPDENQRMFMNAHVIAAGWGHPLAEQARRALSETVSFEEWLQEGTLVMRSSGAGGQVTLELLPQQLMAAAASSWIFGPHWPDPDDLFDRIVQAIADLRRLVSGRTAEVQMLIGVSGLSLPGDARVRLPWGTLRRFRQHERARLPVHAPDVVLDCVVPFRATVTETGRMAELPEEFWHPFTLSEQHVRDLAFALLLTGLTPPPSTARPAFRLTMDPVQGIPQGSWSATTTPEFQPLSLDAQQVHDLERWAAIYADKHHKSLDVAVRRSVSAIRRDDMSDAFIDAVIGWDNAFGSSKGESVLRIAASFARLLGTSSDDRQRIAKQVRDAYELRSRLVHGDLIALVPAEAMQARDQALDLLLRGIRTLYTEREELLARNSGQRSQALLIDEG